MERRIWQDLILRWLRALGLVKSPASRSRDGIERVFPEDPRHRRMCRSNLAQVVARLHARGKTNEAHTKGLRDPVDEDAELALHALGFTLRDIGWADGQ